MLCSQPCRMRWHGVNFLRHCTKIFIVHRHQNRKPYLLQWMDQVMAKKVQHCQHCHWRLHHQHVHLVNWLARSSEIMTSRYIIEHVVQQLTMIIIMIDFGWVYLDCSYTILCPRCRNYVKILKSCSMSDYNRLI
ncbi:hypothetical protein BDF19DRAFT_211878 [Syncephalis fuscata]|nr:hypothetical protein BDF19DRAFT_211878 [Syncephalis fuscata]